jgi:uncharacterized protein (DUF2384 family)
VDSEDAAAFLLRCKQCPLLSLQINYLDHVARREWIITTKEASFRADLIAGTLTRNQQTTRIDCAPDDSYRAMHQALLAGNTKQLCSFAEGLALVKLIDTVAL